MANSNMAAIALQLASQNKESVDETIARAFAYLKFIQNPVSTEAKKGKSVTKEDEVFLPEPTYEEIQQAGFNLVNEKGPSALAEVLGELKVDSIKQINKKNYGIALGKIKEKLVEGDALA